MRGFGLDGTEVGEAGARWACGEIIFIWCGRDGARNESRGKTAEQLFGRVTVGRMMGAGRNVGGILFFSLRWSSLCLLSRRSTPGDVLLCAGHPLPCSTFEKAQQTAVGKIIALRVGSYSPCIQNLVPLGVHHPHSTPTGGSISSSRGTWATRTTTQALRSAPGQEQGHPGGSDGRHRRGMETGVRGQASTDDRHAPALAPHQPRLALPGTQGATVGEPAGYGQQGEGE